MENMRRVFYIWSFTVFEVFQIWPCNSAWLLFTKHENLAWNLRNYNYYAKYFKHLCQFFVWIPFLFMIGYAHNFLISSQKGRAWNVYSKPYPYTSSESIFIHQSRQRSGLLVCLYHFGIHHPFYQFNLFEHSSVHQHSFRSACEPSPILHVYGIKQASMVQTVASIVEYDSNSGNRWPFFGRPGWFHQSQDR